MTLSRAAQFSAVVGSARASLCGKLCDKETNSAVADECYVTYGGISTHSNDVAPGNATRDGIRGIRFQTEKYNVTQ